MAKRTGLDDTLVNDPLADTLVDPPFRGWGHERSVRSPELGRCGIWGREYVADLVSHYERVTVSEAAPPAAVLPSTAPLPPATRPLVSVESPVIRSVPVLGRAGYFRAADVRRAVRRAARRRWLRAHGVQLVALTVVLLLTGVAAAHPW